MPATRRLTYLVTVDLGAEAGAESLLAGDAAGRQVETNLDDLLQRIGMGEACISAGIDDEGRVGADAVTVAPFTQREAAAIQDADESKALAERFKSLPTSANPAAENAGWLRTAAARLERAAKPDGSDAALIAAVRRIADSFAAKEDG